MNNKISFETIKQIIRTKVCLEQKVLKKCKKIILNEILIKNS
jgi:hypothetical protein